MEWLSTNIIIILSGILLVILIILIILLSVNNSKKKKAKKEKNKQAAITESKKTKLVELNKVFLDTNLTKVIAEELGSKPDDKVEEAKLLSIKELNGNAKAISNLQGISQLKNLESIHLADNKLSELPSEINNLANLKELQVSNNRIKNVDNLKTNATLKTLNISNNEIDHLPQDQQIFSNLENLYVNNNLLTTIPSELTSAPKLKELDLSHNMLGALPSTMNNLSMLSSLNLADNLLTQIPQSLASLEKMNLLNLKNNENLVIPNSLDEELRNKKIEVLKDKRVSAFTTPIEDFATTREEVAEIEVFQSEIVDEGNVGDQFMAKTNTYIDLTSSNDDLLSEIKALEKNLEDTMPKLDLVETKIIKEDSNAIRSQVQKAVDDVIPNEISKAQEELNFETEKIMRVGSNMNENHELEVAHEVETKREKRIKIFKIVGAVAGATLAVAAAAGTAVYFYQKNEKEKMSKKKSGFPFLKKGE